MTLSSEDLLILARLSKACNRSAYHGGLGRSESLDYIALIDRILDEHGTSVEMLVPHVQTDVFPPPRGDWKP